MNKRSSRTTSNSSINGLCLSGIVVDRTRRMLPRDNPTTEIVTYTIQDNFSRKFYVDDYAPDDYQEINSSVCLPVYVKTDRRKNGEPSYTLNVQKPEVTRGDHF